MSAASALTILFALISLVAATFAWVAVFNRRARERDRSDQ